MTNSSSYCHGRALEWSLHGSLIPSAGKMTPLKRGGILTSRGYDFSYFQFWWWGGAFSGAPDPTLPKPYSLENERLLILLSVWTSVTEISASWLTQPELETADSTVSSLRPRHRMRHRIDFVQPWSVSASGQDGGGKRPFSIWNQHVFFFPLPLCSFFCHIFRVHISNQLVGV